MCFCRSVCRYVCFPLPVSPACLLRVSLYACLCVSFCQAACRYAGCLLGRIFAYQFVLPFNWLCVAESLYLLLCAYNYVVDICLTVDHVYHLRYGGVVVVFVVIVDCVCCSFPIIASKVSVMIGLGSTCQRPLSLKVTLPL